MDEAAEKSCLQAAIPHDDGPCSSHQLRSTKSESSVDPLISMNLDLEVEDARKRKIGFLDLPEVVLLHIARYLTEPQDLLRFGNTCQKLKPISYTDKLWFIIGMDRLMGIWPYVKPSISGKTSREWVLSFYDSVSPKPSRENELFNFRNGEIWEEVQLKKLGILFHILQMAYSFKEYEHEIFFLKEECLSKIVFFHRKPAINFHQPGPISRDLKTKLRAIGKKDKQCFDNGGGCGKHVQVSQVSENLVDLFPMNEFGSICPLLIKTYEAGLGGEISGFSGLLICFSLVLEKYVIRRRKSNAISLREVAAFMTAAAESFTVFMENNSINWKSEYGEFYLIPAINFMATTSGSYDTKDWQASLNKLLIPLDSKILIKELHDTIRENGGIDRIADKVRHRWRKEIGKFLKELITSYEKEQGCIARINLTDNLKIEGGGTDTFSSAAFISNNCVVVIRHLRIKIKSRMLLM